MSGTWCSLLCQEDKFTNVLTKSLSKSKYFQDKLIVAENASLAEREY